jgi:hypothetical protein
VVGERLVVARVHGRRAVRSELAAAFVAPGPSATAATSPPSVRAFVNSSSALGCVPSGVTSA